MCLLALHKMHQSCAGFAYTVFINYVVFFLIEEPLRKSLIIMCNFHSTVHYAVNKLIKMYRVTRNILTQYKQNSIKSVFSSVLVFCLHSVKVCIDISITQHALVPSYSLKPRWSWSLHQILSFEYCTFRVQIGSLNSLRCCSLNFFSRSPPPLCSTKQRFSTKYCVQFHCFRCRWANT